MDYKSKYKEQKEAVLAFLEKSAALYESLQDENTKRSINDLRLSVIDNTFSIVVVGQFSAGKSTFLNALMGKRYLPSFSNETTATINFLRSVKESPTGKECVRVKYRDNNKSDAIVDASFDTIEKFVSVKGDNVAQTVEYVELFLDSPFLNDGVTLVDSPGLNGVLAGHEQITHDQIDKSHAAIFMFNANQPGSKSDFEILQMLKKRCKSLFIVMNQVDLVEESEQPLSEVIGKVRENYNKYFEGEQWPELYPISAKQALASRDDIQWRGSSSRTDSENKELLNLSMIEQFENRLFKYLTQGEKTQQELLAPVQKVKAYLEQTKQRLQISIDELQSVADSSEVEAQILSLEQELERLQQDIQREKFENKNEIRTLISDAKEEIKAGTKQLKESFLAKLSSDQSSEDLDLLRDNSELYLHQMQSQYSNVISDALKSLEKEFKSYISDKIITFTDKISDNLNKTLFDDGSIAHSKISLDASRFELDVDLDDYLECYNDIKRKGLDLDNRQESVELSLMKAKKDEKRAEDLERKIEREKEWNSTMISTLGPRPGKGMTTRIEERRNWGIGGVLKWFWNGNPPQYREYQVEDDSAQRYYDEQVREINAEHNERIASLRQKLNSISDTDSSVYQAQFSRIEKEKARLDAEMAELKEKHEVKVSKARKTRINQATAYMRECFDTIDQQYRNEVIKSIDKMQSDMSSLVNIIVEESVSKTIRIKQDELKIRKANLESTVEDKAAKVKFYSESIDHIDQIVSDGANVEDDICSIPVDTIKMS